MVGLLRLDIEDVFSPALYASVLNKAFSLPADQQLDAKKLTDADPNTTRLVKKATAYFAVLPPDAPEFDHFTPADYLFRNPNLLDGDAPEVIATLERAERVISALNKILN